MDQVDVARSYYRAIDEDDYDELATLLAPDFVHDRPDRTLDGRDRFLTFMSEERPQTDTRHAVDEVYEGDTGVVVRGRLLDADEGRLFSFLDVFTVDDRATKLVTCILDRGDA
ncbi:nuclear transport factor 2 family protein [Halobacteriaceae archaeon GCM10025711]